MSDFAKIIRIIEKHRSKLNLKKIITRIIKVINPIEETVQPFNPSVGSDLCEITDLLQPIIFNEFVSEKRISNQRIGYSNNLESLAYLEKVEGGTIFLLVIPDKKRGERQ